MNGNSFRVLSLDGGGTWALIQVVALGELYGEDTPGHDILRQFDLIAGTSGGSITLGGLVANMTPREILTFFKDGKKRQQIFVRRSLIRPHNSSRWQILVTKIQRMLAGVGPKYDAAAKHKGLQELLATTAELRMSELPDKVGQNYQGELPHFLITGFDYDLRRASFFRSNLQSRASSKQLALDDQPPRDERNPTLSQAVHASTNAPVDYFDRPAKIDAKGLTAHYWDGAMAGLNNPVLAALTEMFVNAPGYDREEFTPRIAVLSLGTGSVSRWSELEVRTAYQDDSNPWTEQQIKWWMEINLVSRPQKPGLVRDLRRVATCVLDDPPDSASFIAHVMLRQPLPSPLRRGGEALQSTIVRMSPMVRPAWNREKREMLPPAGLIDEWPWLVDLNMDAIIDEEVELIEKVAKLWIQGGIENQPIRESRKGLKRWRCLIGHTTFPEARSTWEKLISERVGA